MSKAGITFVLIFFLFSFYSVAHTQDDFTSELTLKFQRYNELFPKEKVYVQLNKTVFKPKEHVWFKAYVVEALHGRPAEISEEVTIKLMDDQGVTIVEENLPIENGFARGDFNLPKNMEEGIYTLAGYTTRMQEGSPENVFHRTITVVQSLIPEISIHVDFENTPYLPGDTGRAQVLAMTRKKKPMPELEIDYEIQTPGDVIGSGRVVTDNNGTAHIAFTLPEGIGPSAALLRLRATHKKFTETRAVLLPMQRQRIHLTFFPEGGTLVDGIFQRVAFQAFDDLRNPVVVTGMVVNQNNERMAEIQTNRRGLGQFIFTPSIEDNYEARIKMPDGEMEIYPLPAAVKDGIAVMVEEVNPDFVQLKLSTDSPDAQKIYLVTRVGGTLNMASNVVLRKSLRFQIPTKNFPASIAHIAVLDSAGIQKAERLVFVNPRKQARLTVRSDKFTYQGKEPIQLSVRVEDEYRMPMPAELGLSILPAHRLYSSASPHLLSSFRLTSELGEAIHDPNAYFDGDSLMSSIVDSMLLTQTSRHYAWNDVLALDLDSERQNVDDVLPIDVKQDFNRSLSDYFKADPLQSIRNAVRLDRFKYAPGWDEDAALAQSQTVNAYFSESRIITNLFTRVPPWKRHIEEVGILEAIRMIRSYQIVQGKILFMGTGSFQQIVGALIVIDGHKVGTNPELLQMVNPRDVEDIQIYTSPSDTHRYSSSASDGVIEITTKTGATLQEQNPEKIRKRTMKEPLWIPVLELDDTGLIDLSYNNPTLRLPILAIVEGMNEDGRIVRGSLRYDIR